MEKHATACYWKEEDGLERLVYFEKLSGLWTRRQLLRECLRNEGKKKGRPVCSTISGALRAAMSPGYVPWYTERSLSRRCISRDARPGHLTYKMVSVFQLSRDKLWIMGVNTKQLVDYNASSLQKSQERYCLLLRHPRHSHPFAERDTECYRQPRQKPKRTNCIYLRRKPILLRHFLVDAQSSQWK